MLGVTKIRHLLIPTNKNIDIERGLSGQRVAFVSANIRAVFLFEQITLGQMLHRNCG